MIINIPTNELAQFLGKSPGWASNLKSGYRKLPAKDCIRVSERFGIPLYELRKDIYPNPEEASYLNTETKHD